MAGEYTAKIRDYVNIMKSNGLITEDGELITPNIKNLENIAMDFIKMEEQGKEKKLDILQMKEDQTEFQQYLLGCYGSFYFNFYKRFGTIEGQFLFRFIYLATFMNYDNLLSNGVRLIKEEDLMEILLLGKTEFYKTKKYLIENDFISIQENKTILVNDRYCKKGKINKTKSIEVVRMFNNAIQELYMKSTPKEHKKLALLIDILPCINLKFNVICKNPTCEYEENIQPYTMPELCSKLGYDKTHASRLKKDLFKLKVNNEMVIGIFEKENGKAIYVNPSVYYKGGKFEDIKNLQSMFKIK
jgi:hypothetical protein